MGVLFGGAQVAQGIYQQKEKAKQSSSALHVAKQISAQATAGCQLCRNYSMIKKQLLLLAIEKYITHGHCSYAGGYEVSIAGDGKLVLKPKNIVESKTAPAVNLITSVLRTK